MYRLFALTTLLAGVLLLDAWPAPAVAQETPLAAETPATPAAAETTAAPEATEAAGAEAGATTEEASAAADEGPSLSDVTYALDNMMLFLCAVLVLFMQAGFAMVEGGFNNAKNAVNIMFKNAMDICVGVLLFWAFGYGIMYPGEFNGYLGFKGFGIAETITETGPAKLHPQVDWFFQVVFAATAATIVSGAVAGRMKFSAYLVYSALITAFVYPISGSWKWGLGWLTTDAFKDFAGGAIFHDFAGSILVHSVGGFAGLAGAIALGPRIGRYGADGKPQAMPGHNMVFATLGVFVLWVGWYGFNPGSQLAFAGVGNTEAVLKIAVNTTLAAAAGGVAATLISWVMFSKPDLSMALNGILAGLVGITANCDCVTNPESMIIGAVAGVVVVLGILMLDKLRIDDPVGAFPVHGLCGLWGGIATGIFGEGKTFVAQLVGSLTIAAWAFVTMLALFYTLKAIGMLRVSPEEEQKGLDITEHGMHAYVH